MTGKPEALKARKFTKKDDEVDAIQFFEDKFRGWSPHWPPHLVKLEISDGNTQRNCYAFEICRGMFSELKDGDWMVYVHSARTTYTDERFRESFTECA